MKYFAPIGGIFFLSLIGLMFYWLYWDEDAQKEVAQVKKQMVVLERFWNDHSSVRSGKITLGYGDITATGFPFGMRVRLLKPYIRDIQGNVNFLLTSTYVDLVPDEENGGHYTIEYPADAYAALNRGSRQDVFYLHLSKIPKIEIRKSPSIGKNVPAINEYGMLSPPQLAFTVDYQGNTRNYPVRMLRGDEMIWRPIFTNLRERIQYLQQLLMQGVR